MNLVSALASAVTPASADIPGDADASGAYPAGGSPRVPSLAGDYGWRSDASAFFDFETLSLFQDGTYAAKVDARLVNPAVRSFGAACTLPETGLWTAYDVSGRTKVRIRPSTSSARVYEATLLDGTLTLTRRGQRALLRRLECAEVYELGVACTRDRA